MLRARGAAGRRGGTGSAGSRLREGCVTRDKAAGAGCASPSFTDVTHANTWRVTLTDPILLLLLLLPPLRYQSAASISTETPPKSLEGSHSMVQIRPAPTLPSTDETRMFERIGCTRRTRESGEALMLPPPDMLMLLLMLMVTAFSLTATYSSCPPARLFSLPPDTFSATLASPANFVVTSIQKSGVKCDTSCGPPA